MLTWLCLFVPITNRNYPQIKAHATGDVNSLQPLKDPTYEAKHFNRQTGIYILINVDEGGVKTLTTEQIKREISFNSSIN